VNGYYLGYGLTLATWCDFVLASDRAEFGLPEVNLGVPAIVASIRLPQRINWADAMERLLTGERINAERGHAMGLVWRVVPHDALLDEANALARRLLDGAPLAQRAMKEMAMRTWRRWRPSARRDNAARCRGDTGHGGRLPGRS
jgi:enoyl-CoA hydratase/carnithine racemase